MRKKRKNNLAIISVFVIIILIAVIIAFQARTIVGPGVNFNHPVYTSADSTLIEDRHMGYVNYNRFKELLNKVKSQCPTSITKAKGDSVFVKIDSNPHFVYGQNDDWIKKYKNLPIRITKEGFVAKVEKKDSVEYIYIPYQILVNIASLDK